MISPWRKDKNMKIDKRFLTFKIILSILVVILFISELIINLNPYISSSLLELILSGVIGLVAVESYQDRKWWLFTFATGVTVLSILLCLQSIYRFYILSH